MKDKTSPIAKAQMEIRHLTDVTVAAERVLTWMRGYVAGRRDAGDADDGTAPPLGAAEYVRKFISDTGAAAHLRLRGAFKREKAALDRAHREKGAAAANARKDAEHARIIRKMNAKVVHAVLGKAGKA